ncbi:hypothetical protein GCM10009560_79550 [Nonomuraea longicatena]|uniref:Uncharacterized protein n=2 Tax=Nonomuraea longicatena TaxID=83682 RepID=A0ABP4BX40_9ACTN
MVNGTATEPQKNLIRLLAVERGLDLQTIEAGFEDMTKSLASDFIKFLKGLAATNPAKPVQIVEAGFYKLGEKYFEVRESKAGRLYAVEIYQSASGGATSDYAPGIVRLLKPENLLTLDEAKVFGKETGSCCICRRELTNPESIESGIGPVCASRF